VIRAKTEIDMSLILRRESLPAVFDDEEQGHFIDERTDFVPDVSGWQLPDARGSFGPSEKRGRAGGGQAFRSDAKPSQPLECVKFYLIQRRAWLAARGQSVSCQCVKMRKVLWQINLWISPANGWFICRNFEDFEDFFVDADAPVGKLCRSRPIHRDRVLAGIVQRKPLRGSER
jgi:hypothetical protein